MQRLFSHYMEDIFSTKSQHSSSHLVERWCSKLPRKEDKDKKKFGRLGNKEAEREAQEEKRPGKKVGKKRSTSRFLVFFTYGLHLYIYDFNVANSIFFCRTQIRKVCNYWYS